MSCLPKIPFLEGIDRLTTIADYDDVVSAEIPNIEEDPELHRIVTTHMVHGPCGNLNPNCVCMQDGKCQSYYPKPFSTETTHHDDGYPLYRRRSPEDGGMLYQRQQPTPFTITNQHIVPYNPYLLKTYAAHVNVEICTNIHTVKYLFKYVYKGHDRASIELQRRRQLPQQPPQPIDEIKQFVDSTYVSPSEAIWRILGYNMHITFPTVVRLTVHLDGQQQTMFRPGQAIEAVQNGAPMTTLIGMMDAVSRERRLPLTEKQLQKDKNGQLNPTALQLTYSKFPIYYT